MEFNQSVSNPMLVGCIELVKEEDSPEHRNMFVAELLRASFMVPALIDPEPAEDSEGRLRVTPGSRVQFPMLATPDGKKFYMGFTDQIEYRKWAEKNQELPTFALKFDDYVNMILRRDPQGNDSVAQGVIVNPFGANVIIPKEMIAGIVATRMAQAKQMAAMKAGGSMPEELRKR